jgi:hypothetical protein
MPTNGQTTESRQEEPQAEVERLRASLRQAEERIADLQKQRDKYYKFTQAWIGEHCKMSDWDDFDPADYKFEFDENFLAELEAQFRD